jgi:hypothetical protein
MEVSSAGTIMLPSKPTSLHPSELALGIATNIITKEQTVFPVRDRELPMLKAIKLSIFVQ